MTPAYDRELIAQFLEAVLRGKQHHFQFTAIIEQIRLLREADNAEAASVGTAAASEDGLPELPKPAMQARAMRNAATGYEDLVADPTGDCVVFVDDALYTAEQMRAYGEQCRRLAASGQEWQPIETAPKDSRRVLLARAGWPPYVGRRQDGDWIDEDEAIRDPRFWMPLPAAPTQEGK